MKSTSVEYAEVVIHDKINSPLANGAKRHEQQEEEHQQLQLTIQCIIVLPLLPLLSLRHIYIRLLSLCFASFARSLPLLLLLLSVTESVQ
jgi:hypothetical protein